MLQQGFYHSDGRVAEQPEASRQCQQIQEDGMRRNPSGNGSSSVSTRVPIPVMWADPVISGITAGTPPMLVVSTIRPTNSVSRMPQ